MALRDGVSLRCVSHIPSNAVEVNVQRHEICVLILFNETLLQARQVAHGWSGTKKVVDFLEIHIGRFGGQPALSHPAAKCKCGNK